MTIAAGNNQRAEINTVTNDGHPLDVVQVGMRSWFCHACVPGTTPVVIMGIETGSRTVAVERCRELWDRIREAE